MGVNVAKCELSLNNTDGRGAVNLLRTWCQLKSVIVFHLLYFPPVQNRRQRTTAASTIVMNKGRNIFTPNCQLNFPSSKQLPKRIRAHFVHFYSKHSTPAGHKYEFVRQSATEFVFSCSKFASLAVSAKKKADDPKK